MSEIIAVVGSRELTSFGEVVEFVSFLPPDTIIVSGGARGVDDAAQRAALANGLETLVVRPDYVKHGKLAPKVRNWEIAATCDRLVAFWDGFSPGTAHVVSCAVALGKPVEVRRDRDDRRKAAVNSSSTTEGP